MDFTTRWMGWVGFVSGVVVLGSYVARRKIIYDASEELRRSNSFFLWATSASVTAVCFLLVLSLWAMKGNNVTDNNHNAQIFVTGLFVFMSGAVLWPWVLQLELTVNEVSALWVTAIGSFIMFYATWWQIMSVPFTSFIFFHHLFVDGLWWPRYGRASSVDDGSKVGALYIFYFAPLMACVPLSVFGKSDLVAILVVVVTGMHFVVAGVVAWPRFLSVARQRYQLKLAILADVLITTALVLAIVHLANGMDYSWTAVIAALLGNLFCWKTRGMALPKVQYNVQYNVILLTNP